MSSRSWIAVAGISLIAISAVLVHWGDRARAGAPRVEAFTGECTMRGVIRHDPPLTNQPASVQVRGRFSGLCTGELTNRAGRTSQVDDVNSIYKARSDGELSCLGGTTTGNGLLIVGRRPGRRAVIDVSITERRTPGVAVVTLVGAAGGSGSVTGTVSAEEFVHAGERCAGSGLRRLEGEARILASELSG